MMEVAEVRERTERKLEKSGRITPREVLEAYRETGLTPRTQCYLSGDGDEACAFGALMVRQGLDLRYCGGDRFINAVDRRAGYGYSLAFFYGFDGERLPVFPGDARTPEELAGWRDGRRARRFVFGPDA